MDSNRHHLRFTCDGSADVTADGNGRCWGHLTDISLGGFYVSTFGPMPVETEVRFRLEVAGKQISGVGSVATSHPGVGMAVLYKELPADYQKTLEEVIENLEQAGAGTNGISISI
jgi:hypothetical protein